MSPEFTEFFFLYSESGTACVHFDVRAEDPAERVGYEHGFRVRARLPDQRVLEDGSPAPEAEEWLLQLESSLETAVEPAKAWNIGRLTYSGCREWIFACRFSEIFSALAENWKKTAGLPVDFFEEEVWPFYDAQLLPDEFLINQIGDRKKLDAAVEQGLDTSDKITLVFSFRGENDLLRAISEELKEDGFLPAENGDRVLRLRKSCEPGLEAVCRLTWALRQFCKDVGLSYGGWESVQ